MNIRKEEHEVRAMGLVMARDNNRRLGVSLEAALARIDKEKESVDKRPRIGKVIGEKSTS